MEKKIFAIKATFVLFFVFVIFSIGTAHAAELPKVFPAFSSQNLDGEPVDSSIFSGKKLTMVNIWTTWCPPCIREMPDLGRLGRSMPEGAQLIGIILDAEEPDVSRTIVVAKSILSKSNADFVQILPSMEMAPILDWVEAIPTTIFVDSKGQIVGEPHVGALDEEGYRAEVEKLLKSM